MSAATTVFHLPELLEHILLSLPHDTTHQELSSMRTLLLSRTASRTWHNLLQTSPLLRQRLYLPSLSSPPPSSFPSSSSSSSSKAWSTPTPFPPARPNPWIPDLLLHQRSWGSAYPFDPAFADPLPSADPWARPSQPRLWTFTFEMSRSQYARMPRGGDGGGDGWRRMLAAHPPFTACFYTRCVYELGSGRAPEVEFRDLDVRRPGAGQRYRVFCEGGITLGHLCDTMGELFERHRGAKFVMVKSFRGGVEEGDEEEEERS